MEINFLYVSLNPYSLFFIIFFILFLFRRQYDRSITRPKLPPGPWKFPVIGNLHQLMGSSPYHVLKTLAMKHGPLMHINLGQLPTIVVSSPETAKQIIKTNDVAFCDKMDLMMAKIVLYNSSDIASAPYGEYWRKMRKLCISEFLGATKVRMFFSLMEDEISNLVHSVRFLQGQGINLSKMILAVQCRIICMVTVGRACKDQDSLIKIIKEALSIAGVFNFADVFPSIKLLQFLSSGSRRRLENLHKRVDFILEDIIEQHKEKRVSRDMAEKEDIVDVFLRVSESEKDLQVPNAMDHIKANILEMFIGGTESSSFVIEWTMSEMIKHPRVMMKAQDEVRRVLHGKQKISATDVQKLRYLEMVIKETLRLHPPGPLLFPRRCRKQTRIDGYDIPVGTIVMINVWAIGRDPKVWDNPEKFEPERFEDVAADFHGNHFEFIPFGAGRRMCPGIAFGLTGVGLTLANLLYHFDWKIPGGISPEEFDMTENFGASAGRKSNLFLIAKPYITQIF